MSLSLSFLLFVIIIGIYLLIIEIFTVIFRLTGLSHEKANFQAVSLLTTCGFTTSESEIMLATKPRREIAKTAMMFGYMFSVVLASSIINLIISITRNGTEEVTSSIILLVLSLIFFIMFFRIKIVRKKIDDIIKKTVEKVFMKNAFINPYYILEIYGKQAICELLVTDVPEELKGKTIIESNVRALYGLSYISINRKNENRVIDPFKDIIQKGDKVVIYGNPNVIEKVFKSSFEYVEEK